MSTFQDQHSIQDPCIECGRAVEEGDEAVDCDICAGWQHIACNTAISSAAYQAAVRGKLNCFCLHIVLHMMY